MNTVSPRRPYRMTARADAARATRDRILAATDAVFWERPTDSPSIEAVAARAGVTKQTVLRHFGTKAALLAAAAERGQERIDAERGDVAPDDPGGAVRALVAHYERIGDGVLRMLAEEVRNPGLRELADRGRASHEAWCERAFAPPDTRRLAQLVVATDVYAWKLLRRDRGMSRTDTEATMLDMVERLVA